jgi:hypothetical protein
MIQHTAKYMLMFAKLKSVMCVQAILQEKCPNNTDHTLVVQEVTFIFLPTHSSFKDYEFTLKNTCHIFIHTVLVLT